MRDALAQAQRVLDIELNSVTDNPLLFPDLEGARNIEDQVVSAGHFHGMPLALAMSYLKAAIPVLASISERRLNKLVDPATNDGLPAFLIGNEDGTESGFMIVQYTAAAIVNDLCSRAHPASVYSIPTSANAEDHVSMGANEARHVLDMLPDLARVLGLEIYTAAQALDFRRDMINAARELARSGDAEALPRKCRARRAPMRRPARSFCARWKRCGLNSRKPRNIAPVVPWQPRLRACVRTSPSWTRTGRWTEKWKRPCHSWPTANCSRQRALRSSRSGRGQALPDQAPTCTRLRPAFLAA